MAGVFSRRAHNYSTVSGPVYAHGALVCLTADTTTSPIPWDAEVYDAGNWHDSGSNPSRITMPSGITVARAISNVLDNTTNTTSRISMLLNGAVFRGQGEAATETNGNQTNNIASAPVAVAAANYIEATRSTGVNATADAKTWFAVEEIDASLKKVCVYKGSTQALSASTVTTVTWDNELYDDGGWHDNVTNNSRITVPSGTTGLIEVSANLVGTAATGQFVLSFLKNGASARGLPAKDADVGTGSDMVNAVSAILAVTAGDYIEVQAFSTAANTIQTSEGVWFSAIEVATSLKRALVNKTGNQSVSLGVETALTFDAEVYDTDSIHDNVTNNTRLTAPSGITEARVRFGIKTNSIAAQMIGRVKKNGSSDYGLPSVETDTGGTDSLCGLGAWVPCTPGDYWELYFLNTSAAVTIGTDNETYFGIEFR